MAVRREKNVGQDYPDSPVVHLSFYEGISVSSSACLEESENMNNISAKTLQNNRNNAHKNPATRKPEFSCDSLASADTWSHCKRYPIKEFLRVELLK